jgi:hypothetical protein
MSYLAVIDNVSVVDAGADDADDADAVLAAAVGHDTSSYLIDLKYSKNRNFCLNISPRQVECIQR